MERKPPAISQSRWTLDRVVFVAIVVAFAVLSLVYGLVTPSGEGVDEGSHLQYTLYIRNHHALPILPFVATPDTVYFGYHAPLYYIASALLIAPIDTSDVSRALRANPHFVWIEGYGPGNRNVFLHSPVTGGDTFPYRGVVLAIHLLRVFLTLQGIVALIAARAILQRLLVGRSALVLAATAATAFQPTFIDAFSVAQTDGVAALFILLGLLWCIRFVEGFSSGKAPSAALGGATLGLALLGKETTLVLGPVYAVAFGLVVVTTRRWRRALAAAAVVCGVTLLIAGWWYARNVVLYGDPLAETVYRALCTTCPRPGTYQWGNFLFFVRQVQRNYWGAFGYEHILVDQRVGNTLWIVLALAIPGFVVTLIGRRRWRLDLGYWLVAGSMFGSLAILFTRWSMLAGGGAGHGRYFVGIIPVVQAVIVTGLARLTPARWPIGPLAFAAGMTAFGVAAPFAVIAPAYRPPIAAPTEVSAATPLDVAFGDQLALAATTLTPTSIHPGTATTLTLYWTRLRPIDLDLRFRVRMVARDGAVFFDKSYWPAGGGVPTDTWPAAVTYRDVVPVPVPSNVAAGTAHVLVSVQTADGKWLDSRGSRDVDVGHAAIADVPVVVAVPPDATPVGATFGDRTVLVAARLPGVAHPGGSLGVSLFWRATAPVDEDATVSVQLLSPAGRLVAQNDSEPARGHAPTSTWPVGSLVVDDHQVSLPSDLPAGTYRLIVALYTRPTLTRLRATLGGQSSDHVVLGNLRVTR